MADLIAELEERARKRYVRWDQGFWRRVLDGPARELAASLRAAGTDDAAAQQLLESYLRLACEGIGLGYFFPPELGEGFFTHAFFRLIPAGLAGVPHQERARALADAWNLGENLEHAPAWWRRMFVRLSDGATLGALQALVVRASRDALGEPSARLAGRTLHLLIDLGAKTASSCPERSISSHPPSCAFTIGDEAASARDTRRLAGGSAARARPDGLRRERRPELGSPRPRRRPREAGPARERRAERGGERLARRAHARDLAVPGGDLPRVSETYAEAADAAYVARAWKDALAVWDVAVSLSPPEPFDGKGASHWNGNEPLAYIDLTTRQVVVNLPLLAKLRALSSLTAVLAHEVGHHVRFPHSLALAASLQLLEKRLIPGLKQSLTNLFFDLLVNEFVGRTRADELCRVYQGFVKDAKSPVPLFSFYLAVYEELWGKPPGHLVPKKALASMAKAYPGWRAEARMFVQTFYALPGVHLQFVYFCSRFLRYIPDPEKLEYVIPLGHDVPEPDEDALDAAVRGLGADEAEAALGRRRSAAFSRTPGSRSARGTRSSRSTRSRSTGRATRPRSSS